MSGPAVMTRRVIRADGTVIPLAQVTSVHDALGGDVFDTVSLRHLGAPLWIMVVDDLGHAKGLPVNAEATALYWANCRPGTTHEIRGDVLIQLDSDF